MVKVLEYVFEELNTVPNFPETAFRALRMLEDENVNFQDLAKVIRYDATITANFLKLVNSAYIGLRRKVESLAQAFALLGLNQIRFFLVAACAGQYLNRALHGYGLSPYEVWLHSLGSGVFAELIAEKVKIKNPDHVFTAALLHDIGKLVLDLFVGGELEVIRELVKDEGLTFMEAEIMVLGTDHAVIGAELLRRWGFPQETIFAVRAHHDEDWMVQNQAAAIVALSNMLTNLLGIGMGADGLSYRVPPKLLKVVGLKDRELFSVITEGFKRYQNLKENLLSKAH
ncbi:MAG TPA: HDOD domain-containing protein [Thermodesulfatator atlanticus]|uniref:HDOD domain-containing protein n=1 Tax=Thermodesulfatator atlanticus TaxID=501497 RepID=A0A7V5U3D3_9BACT|nr:HDOD domain-containing protein [Thermodesulfatator atlanticus]